LPGWRQDAKHLRTFKKAHRRIQKLRHSTSQDEKKRQAREGQIQQAYRDYLGQAETLLGRMQAVFAQPPDYAGHSIVAQLRFDAKIQPYHDELPFFAYTILTRSAKPLSDIANHHKS